MMNKQIIFDLQERYKNIKQLTSDKAFFTELIHYVDYIMKINDESDNVRQIILDSTQKAQEEINYYEKTFDEIVQILEKKEKLSIEEETILQKKSGLLLNLKLKRNVSPADAWAYLFLLWQFIDNNQFVGQLLNNNVISESLNSSIFGYFVELNNILAPSFNETTYKIVKIDGKKENKYVTRENYLAFLTQFHEFLINELRALADSTFVTFSLGQTVIYDEKKHIVFFRIENEINPESIDFSRSAIETALFESFWELKKIFNRNTFTLAEIATEYKKHQDEYLNTRRIASIIANIRKRVSTKDLLTERLKFIAHGGKSWTFEIF